MKSPEQLAIDHLEHTEGLGTVLRHKPLVELIKRVRAEQDSKTRKECCLAIVQTKGEANDDYLIHRSDVYDAISNVKAL